jgi:hypothetical protein
MKKLLLALGLLLACAVPSFSQSTTVSGQITDAGAQAWNNGNYTFTFVANPNYPGGPYTWTGGALSTTITGALNGTGGYSVSIPANTSISPVGSTWQLKVCPQATPAPCFSTANTTITGATQTLNATPPAISVSPGASVSVYATSEVSSAQIGSQVYLLGTGLQICSAVTGTTCTSWTSPGGNAAGPSNGANVITAGQLLTTYGAKFDVGIFPDATVTNTSNSITCPDCKFLTGPTPAKVGQIVWGVAGGAPGLASTAVLFGGANQTTISIVDSDTQIHVVGNSNTSSSGAFLIAWGDDDTTAINAAWTAGGCTAVINAPGGASFISAPVFQAIAGCVSVANSNNGFRGQRLQGANTSSTYFVPLPTFNYTSILAGAGSGIGAFGNNNISDLSMFDIWGLGFSSGSAIGTANTALLMIGGATSCYRVGIIGWNGGNNNSSIGAYINGATDMWYVGGSVDAGSYGLVQAGVNVQLANNEFSCISRTTTGGYCVQTKGGSSTLSTSNFIIGTYDNGGTTTHLNDTMQGQTNFYTLTKEVNSVTNLVANNILNNAPATTSGGILFASTGAVLNIGMNNQIGANGAAIFTFNVPANNTVNEDGMNNTYVATGSAAVWNNTGTWNNLNFFSTVNNCSSNASPAVCGSARFGSAAIPVGTNPTLVINTTQVTANSQIILNIDESLGAKLGVTCNTTLTTLPNPVVTARTAATSFTVQLNAITATNPVCMSWQVIN